jgi:hypothetical protein
MRRLSLTLWLVLPNKRFRLLTLRDLLRLSLYWRWLSIPSLISLISAPGLLLLWSRPILARFGRLKALIVSRRRHLGTNRLRVLRLLRWGSLAVRTIFLFLGSLLFPLWRRCRLLRRNWRRWRLFFDKRGLKKVALELHRLNDGRFLSLRWRGDLLYWLFRWRFVKDIEIEVVKIIEISPYFISGNARCFFRLHWWLSRFGLKILEICPKRIEPIIITSERILGGSERRRRLDWWGWRRGFRIARG